jgi:hypothetical protein
MTINPQSGDVGFSTIAGAGGAVPYWGQALLKDGCRFDHAFWVVHPVDHPDYPDGLIIQAMPHGAEYQPLRPRLAPGFAYASVPLTDEQRADVPRVATMFMTAGPHGGPIGYSLLSYPVLACIQFHIPVPHAKAFIGRRGNLMCSQLVDRGLFSLKGYAGQPVPYNLFDDGRWVGDVTPGDLYYALDLRVIQPAPAAVDGA